MLLWCIFFALAAAKAAPQSKDLAEKKDGQSKYRGAQVLRVKVATRTVKDLLDTLQSNKVIEIWKRLKNENFTDILVPASSPTVKDELENTNATFRVLIPDVELAMKAENPSLPSKHSSARNGLRGGHSMTFNKYHRLNDIYGYLDYLSKTFPTLCSIQSIGKTVEGRDIKVIIIPGKTAKFSFVIEGGIHAREWVSPASVVYIIRELVEYRSKNPFANNFDFYIVPIANPDGYDYTHTKDRLWRKNRRNSAETCPGVDLNRNYGYEWGGLGASRDTCDETFAGPNSFSEPESRAMRDYVSKISKTVQAYVSFHSYGQYILYPFGYDRVLTSDSSDLLNLGKKIAKNIKSGNGATYQVGNSAILLYPASGGSDDWAKGELGVKYTYTIELRAQENYGFLLPANMIVPTAKDALIAIKTMAKEITTKRKRIKHLRG